MFPLFGEESRPGELPRKGQDRRKKGEKIRECIILNSLSLQCMTVTALYTWFTRWKSPSLASFLPLWRNWKRIYRILSGRKGGENPIATKRERDFEEQNTSTYNNHTQSLTQKTFTDEGRRQRSSCSQRLKALFPPNTLLFFFFFFFYHQDVFFYFARCFLWEHKRDDDEEEEGPSSTVFSTVFSFPSFPSLRSFVCGAV